MSATLCLHNISQSCSMLIYCTSLCIEWIIYCNLSMHSWCRVFTLSCQLSPSCLLCEANLTFPPCPNTPAQCIHQNLCAANQPIREQPQSPGGGAYLCFCFDQDDKAAYRPQWHGQSEGCWAVQTHMKTDNNAAFSEHTETAFTSGGGGE